ncbi:MAG: trypsin-like peptidase domain-containing protein [Bacteroidales bacterium]|nr:trypsin-like peptidase domain-containing protein [Bacteroidales bacterium]MDD3990190.1 trypsin-like peptidase domain-containing protein [Bacteroidales bacterium]MDD4639340.1 trypsin-like peptidase domain-containing protein [Bacteroidales bacterium]
MRFRGLFIIALLAIILVNNRAYSHPSDFTGLEKVVKKAIQKAYPSSVRIWGYDTVKNIQNSSQFSGVVVTKEGHILTVAHAILPGKTYKVRFPDGREAIALSLGRIGTINRTNYDLGMMKISDEGPWPFTEMGWSNSLKINQPCISISYPAMLNRLFPSVRFGRISNVLNQWGFVQSTCKMEPGDSGGPLLDHMGRVIALHSRCDQKEDYNYEVPVDLYRKYWNALNVPEDYKVLPETMDEIGTDSLSSRIVTYSSLEKADFDLPELPKRESSSVVSLTSTINGKQVKSLGTVVILDSKSYIIGKSSVVGSDVQITAEDKSYKASIAKRNIDNDLVVLIQEKHLKGGLTIEDFGNAPDSLSLQNAGTFLISPLPDGRKTSVISSNYFNLPKRISAGFFGASAHFVDKKIIINRIYPKSPADSAKLMIGDQVTGINGIPISLPPEYGNELRKYDPGDSISVECIRADSLFSTKLLLTVMPAGTHIAEHFDGGRTVRCDGFEKVFSHDAAIRADECGGPVFDTRGRFLGINIARFSRTTTLVLPAPVIFDIITKDQLNITNDKL